LASLAPSEPNVSSSEPFGPDRLLPASESVSKARAMAIYKAKGKAATVAHMASSVKSGAITVYSCTKFSCCALPRATYTGPMDLKTLENY
jgi:hypothetical protein